MKIGDAIKVKAPRSSAILGVGLVVECVPLRNARGVTYQVRAVWSNGKIDQVWRSSEVLELISESR